MMVWFHTSLRDASEFPGFQHFFPKAHVLLPFGLPVTLRQHCIQCWHFTQSLTHSSQRHAKQLKSTAFSVACIMLIKLTPLQTVCQTSANRQTLLLDINYALVARFPASRVGIDSVGSKKRAHLRVKHSLLSGPDVLRFASASAT